MKHEKASKPAAKRSKTSNRSANFEVRKTKGGETHQQAEPSQLPITTNQGLQIADNQNSLKAGERGPTLLEDFIVREKITHFDHERIPERIVVEMCDFLADDEVFE